MKTRQLIYGSASLFGTLLMMVSFQNCQGGNFSMADAASLAGEQQASTLPAPIIQLNSELPPLINSKQYAIAFSVTTAPGVNLKTATCQLDQAAAVDCSNLSFNLTNLSEGDHIVRINANDLAGRHAAELSIPFRVDTVQPVLNVSQFPAVITSSSSATFVFSAVDTLSGVKSYECSRDAAAFLPCTSPVNLAGLTEKAYNYRIRAVDNAGNLSAVYSYNWTVSTAAAMINITSRPANFSNSSAANFVFNGTWGGVAIAQFECSLDGLAFAACTSPASFTGLSEAAHTFAVRGKNAAGTLSTPVMINWTVDVTAPTAPVITTATTSSTFLTTASFSFTSTDAGSRVASYECSLDNSAFVACTSPRSFPVVAVGAHSFQVKALDNAGNSSAASSFNWVVVAPTPTWNVGPISFTEGSGTSVDLKSTLPTGTILGGSFSVDAAGDPLPAGMTLSAAGILSVGNAAPVTLSNVIFVYNEP